MTLLGCFTAPHPPIIIREVGGSSLAEAQSTVQAMTELGKRTALLAPDTMVLMSPHSPLARSQMGISLAAAYQGSLAYFHAPQVRLRLEGDPELATALMEAAHAHGVPVIATASAGEIMELDHGAMVPLLYLTRELRSPVRLVLLSFSFLSLEEHVRYGEIIGEVLLGSPRRVVYVASSDLSHRLIPGAPAGYDPRGAAFDRKVAETFAAGDWEGLLSIEPGLVSAAGECGYRSLAVLSGVVAAARRAGLRTSNHLLSYEGPWGVGYLVGEVEIATEESGEEEEAGKDAGGRTEVPSGGDKPGVGVT